MALSPEQQKLLEIIFQVLKDIAPEVETSSLDRQLPLRDQVDLDSMDFLKFLVGLHEKFKIDIPEVDYGKLSSLTDLASYIESKLKTSQR